MSSAYPILDNKPIDQWKVTELKEELKRRKLKTSGKKDDLIKLLDQAIRIERENAEKEAKKAAEQDADNGAYITSKPVVEVKDAEEVPIGSGTAKDVPSVNAKKNEKVDNVVVQLDINSFAPGFSPSEDQERDIAGDNNENVAALGQEKFLEGDMTGGTSPARADTELGFQVTGSTVTESVVTGVALDAEVALSGQELQNSGMPGGNMNLNMPLKSEDSKPQLKNEDLNTPHTDDVLGAPAPDNQVSESVVTGVALDAEVALSGQELQNSGMPGGNMNLNMPLESGDSKPQLKNEDSKPLLENVDLKTPHRDDMLDASAPDNQVSESVVTGVALHAEVDLSGQELQNSGMPGGNMNLNMPLESGDSNPQLKNEDSKPLLENEDLKTPHTDDMLDAPAPDNQVSDVSAILGCQVKNDSISSDSLSNNEKIELKDNMIADNVKLELDVNKSEMAEPSSGNVVPGGGELYPMEVEEPLEEKASVYEKDDDSAIIADMGKKINSADMGYSEKLNLDRSSGDDSLEDDVLESKQIDSKDSSYKMRDRTEKNEVPVVKEESLVDVGDSLSAENKHAHVENQSRAVMPAEKRKISDQEAVGINEPSKRLRKWNTESLKLSEQQSSTPISIPRDAMKRDFSRSDSAISEETPRERIVPPSPKSPTNSLRIDHFVRPFTLKAVHELLGKTGTFTSFWMDHIKTHCYVTYSSVEEAIETRNALYNIQWPPNNGGRPLVAEFVEPQEVKMRTEAPPSPAAPVITGSTAPAAPVSTGLTAPAAPPTLQPQPSPREPATRQQLPTPPTLLPPPPPSNPAPARERITLPPPPPLPDKLEPPIVTLDDLFRKTKAVPRIYFLPLSEEQVAAKLGAQTKNTKQ